ncbi:unnamed protein product [Bursaphelenchus okinawaensis]|uniref:Uncharacterized protein n=1 Tax=Bursaphelenchus okinawaensis TaxID=465554 RepID=A0A811LLE9_9BILA|nr:unnamed protein product [Bursaphelenchus okinawaensis]CAG9123999.1 unnamed protein product [Bursaphelenchus okinawaensis]
MYVKNEMRNRPEIQNFMPTWYGNLGNRDSVIAPRSNFDTYVINDMTSNEDDRRRSHDDNSHHHTIRPIHLDTSHDSHHYDHQFGDYHHTHDPPSYHEANHVSTTYDDSYI